MAWTAPRTWVTGEVPTATVMNAHIRDNVLALVWQENVVATSETTTSTTYVNLTTTGPSLTLTTLTAVYAIVACQLGTAASSTAFMSVAVSGTTTIAASDAVAVDITSSVGMQGGRISQITGLTAGAGNVFTAKYRVNGGTGTFLRRHLAILGVA